MDDLSKKYLDFWEDVAQKTILNPELQEQFFDLCEQTLESFQSYGPKPE